MAALYIVLACIATGKMEFSWEIERAGAELRALVRGPGGQRFVGFATSLVFLGDHRGFLEAVAFACGEI